MIDTYTFYSVVRIFVECSENDAKLLANEFVGLFDKPILALDIEKYYKETGWYEISFQIKQLNNSPNKALEDIGKILGTGWDYHFMETDDDYSSYAIWNQGKDSTFTNQYVRFANIETFIPDQNKMSKDDYLSLD